MRIARSVSNQLQMVGKTRIDSAVKVDSYFIES